MTFNARKLLEPITWPDIAATKGFAYKGLKIGVAALSVAIAAHMAVVKIPALTSSSIDDYMRDNNAPIALIEQVKGSDIQVYDHNDIFSAHHYAWNSSKRAKTSSVNDTIDASDNFNASYKKYFNYVKDGDARVSRDFYVDGGDQIVMSPRMDIKEYIHQSLGFDVEDIEVDENLAESRYLFTLMHEISHVKRPDYHGAHDHDHVAKDSENEGVLRGEIAADYGSVMALKDVGHDVADYIIAWRSVVSVSKVATHDTQYYLDGLIAADGNSVDLPDVNGHEADREKLEEILKIFKDKYDQNLSDREVSYMAMLDFLDDDDLSNEATHRMVRTAELYIDGVEFFIPGKAQQLRELRDDVKNNFPKKYPSDAVDVDVPSV